MKQSSFLNKYKELLLGLAMLALAVFYLYHSTFIKVRSSVSVSAKLIPEILGTLVVILAAAQIWVGLTNLKKTLSEDKKNGTPSVLFSEDEKGDSFPIALTFVLILGYAIVFEWMGFILASFVCMFLQMMLMAPKEKRNPKLFAAISLVSAIVVYIAFRMGLNLSLPRGLLEWLPF